MDEDVDTLIQNTEVLGVDPAITFILKKTSCQPRAIVKSELSSLDFDALRDCRLFLFEKARHVYEAQLHNKNVQNIVQIEPKMRKKNETTSSDIIDLFLFAIGVREDFPRDSIKDLAVFRDITDTPEEVDDVLVDVNTEEEEAKGSEEENGGAEDTSVVIEEDEGETEEVVEDGAEGANDGNGGDLQHEDRNPEIRQEPKKDEEIASNRANHPDDVCTNCDKEVKRIWAYLYNLETVSSQRISDLEAQLKKCKMASSPHSESISSERRENQNKEQSASGAKETEEKKRNDEVGSASSGAAKKNETRTPKNKSPVSEKSQEASTSSSGSGQTSGKKLFPEPKNPTAGKQNTGEKPSSSKNQSSANKHTGEKPSPSASDHAGDKPQDSKHYQVGGDKRFPNKTKRRTLAAAQPDVRNSSQTQRRGLTAARGHNSRSVELYLPNIAKHPEDSLKDVAEMVRDQGRRCGIYILESRVIRNRYNSNVVGCKISVPERQVDDALGNRVWPEGIKARRWSAQKRGRQNENRGQPRQSWRRSQYEDEQYDGSPQHDEQWNENWNDGNDSEWPELNPNQDGYYYYDEDDEYYENEDCENWEERYQENHC